MPAEQESPVPESADPALHELYRRWACVAAEGQLPSADDLNFDALVSEFPGAAIIEVQRDSSSRSRYRFARVGPTLSAVLAREIEGYSIDELVSPQQIGYYESVYDGIVGAARPHYWMRMNALKGASASTFERLLVPVSDDGETVDALVGVWNWVDL